MLHHVQRNMTSRLFSGLDVVPCGFLCSMKYTEEYLQDLCRRNRYRIPRPGFFEVCRYTGRGNF